MNKKSEETMKKIENIVEPFDGEIQASLLMQTYINVFINKGLEDSFQGREALKEKIQQLIDDLSFYKLLSILPLIVNMSNNPGESLKKRKEVTDNQSALEEKLLHSLESSGMNGSFEDGYRKGMEDFKSMFAETVIKKEFKLAYQKGYQEGLENNRAYQKGIREGERLQNKQKKNLYEEAYNEGFEKGKELRIKDLKKMRGWD